MEIAKAPGFSRRHAWLVRKGLSVPRPVQYEAPARLLGAADGHSA